MMAAQLQSLLGLVLLAALAWLAGGCRPGVRPRVLLAGLGGMVVVAAAMLHLPPLRAGFALLSEEMPVILEAFAPEVGGAVYRMHCPMAFDGRGAAWLH